MARVFNDHAQCIADGVPTPLGQIELDLVGTDHYTAGGWLARKWGLPPEIVTVLERHAVPLYRDAHWPLVQLIGHSARWVADAEAGQEHEINADHAFVDVLGIPLDRLERIGTRMMDRNAELEDLARTIGA
jgi:HD-like signal output (HDOD) protein